MKKRFFLPIVAALVLMATFLSCKKDDGNNVKLLRLEMGSSSYEYDNEGYPTKCFIGKEVANYYSYDK